MADMQQQGAQLDDAPAVPQPEMDLTAADNITNNLKRAAPEVDESEAPEAKQARLEDAAAQG